MTTEQLIQWRAILRYQHIHNSRLRINRQRKALAMSMLLAIHYILKGE